MVQVNNTYLKGKTRISEYPFCPVCGEEKVFIRSLDNGGIGFWCDNCLYGVPNNDYPLSTTINELLNNYKNSLKSKLNIDFWEK